MVLLSIIQTTMKPPVENQCGDTHTACKTRTEKEGGKTRCCYCVPHDDCDFHKPSAENWEEKVGGKIHKILNETLSRKLTLAEYRKLIELVDSVFKRLDGSLEEQRGRWEKSLNYMLIHGYYSEPVQEVIREIRDKIINETQGNLAK